MSDLRDLYQEVILDHNKHPRNFHVMPQCSCHAEGFNPLCGDKLTLYVQMKDDVIHDVSFIGSGCAISTASASLLTEAVIGKTKAEAEALFHAVHDLLTDQKNVATVDIGKLTVLSGVKEFPARVKCASLAWHTLHAALIKQATVVSTE